MRCEMDRRLTAAHLHADCGRLEEAAALLPEIEDLLHRAIECGALVDPWNILGFAGQFSLFPAPENSVPDHRIAELIELMNDLFGLYARLEMEAAAAGNSQLCRRLSEDLGALARWWDQFASTEVSEVEGISGAQTWESTALVAGAVRAWHEAGTAAGDVGFWRRHVDKFCSPKAYALLVETLLDRRDLVASMALLVHWLSQAGQIQLSEGRYSFHDLALRWMETLWTQGPAVSQSSGPAVPGDRWSLARKFFDYLEANAEEYGEVPQLELLTSSTETAAIPPEEQADEEPGDLFAAAYEGVSYRDTTDDGFEGETMEAGESASDFQLAAEAEQIRRRLAFLSTLARLWKLVAVHSAAPQAAGPDREEALAHWIRQSERHCRGLAELLASVHACPVPAPKGTYESLLEYDHRRAVKETLLDRVIATCVEMADARRVMAMTAKEAEPGAAQAAWERPVLLGMRALFSADAKQLRTIWPDLLAALRKQPLLYVPTTRGGNPQRILASRQLQQVLRRLLACLPRLGLLSETYELISTIQKMERDHRVGPGAITEFDRLFEIACGAIVECLVASSESWPTPRGHTAAKRSDYQLIELLEVATEQLLRRWLEHSRNIRISVLESVADRNRWRALKQFIQRYGGDLFTQKFMNFGNLRAILQQGTGRYLRWLEEEPDTEEGRHRLLDDLDGPISRAEAEQWLEITIEAVLENYSEYVDYNSTTTQSDRGEMLYTLLDFLRLEASYERVAWNLKPVISAHEVLVRAGRGEAARLWRAAIAKRSAPIADEHLRRFERLSKRYGMRLSSVAERLRERFVRPLAVDRLRALVRPAIEELRKRQPLVSFPILERELAPFLKEPGGTGFELPSWLEALEEEIEQARSWRLAEDDLPGVALPIPQVRLSVEELLRELGRCH